MAVGGDGRPMCNHICFKTQSFSYVDPMLRLFVLRVSRVATEKLCSKGPMQGGLQKL